ncbi:hypothetical protein [uncultured Methylobacterium sp.]|jgi:hypothetical protein|uniref:hypothetical protein n=1 Tax=uncultured Methylobacterium sp. TaxID=157278 RepID=UPI00262B6D4C|nr:hypothetical protein [uncultured Methylobacterium sp.]
MSALRYEIWVQASSEDNVFDGRLIKLMASGTVTLSSTRSAAITLPKVGSHQNPAIVLKVIGTDKAYVEFLPKGQTSAQTGAHLAADAKPRQLVGQEDGTIVVTGPAEGSFTVVQAAAVA